MKKTRKIRLLAFILTLCLTLGALPLYVFADGTETELPEQITETTNENLTAFQLGLGEKSVAELENMTLSAADIPASISRETVEAKDHVLRLREQEADLNTVIFQNRDGGKTVYLFGSPVKYVDANGNIRDKSTTLVSENVTVNGKTYAHSATDNFFGQYYPTMPQNGVMLAFGPYTVEMKPVITGILTLRDTVVSDNKVTYNKVFGNGTRLVYTPTLNGVKEDIILQTYTGKSSFSFTLKTNGLAILQDENDTFLADFEGNKVASLGDVIITDKVGKTAYGTMTVVTKIEREEYTVTVNAPTAFLTNPTTVYPVIVDPTILIYDAASGEMDEYGNATYNIEDLCIYNGFEDPYYNGNAYIGNYYYSGESDAEPDYARILYRITEPAVNSNNLRQLISSPNLHSVKLHVYSGCYESSVDVVALPYESGWISGDSQFVSSMPYVEYDPEYFATTTISNTFAQFIDIDITDAINSYDDSEETISSVGFMLKVIGEGGEDTDCYNRAFIYQTENIGSNLYIAFDYDTFAGEYYINSKMTGRFLKGTNVNANISTGSYVSDNSIKWRIVYAGDGKYYIISKNIIGAYAYETGETMKLSSTPTIGSNAYKWIITEGANGEYTIKNAGSQNYVYGAFEDTTYISSYTSDYAVWRFSKINDYVNLISFSVEDIVMEVGETVTPTITTYPANATWASASDFTIQLSDSQIFIKQNNMIQAAKRGNENIILVHNLTGLECILNITVVNLKIINSFDSHIEESKNLIIGQKKLDSQNSYKTIQVDDEVQKQIDNIIFRTRTNILGGYFIQMPSASDALAHFLDNTGTLHTVNCSTIINESTNAEYFYNTNLDGFKEDIRLLIKEDGTYKVGTIFELTFIESKDGTGELSSGGNVPQNWWFTIGSASAYMNATVTKVGAEYTCQINYYLCDFYDWEDNGLGAGFVTDAEMKFLHETGVAKEFEVTGKKEISITISSEE